MNREKLKIYIDGACVGNPGKGGWAVLVVENNRIITTLKGFERETTNNRMELTALLKALEWIKKENLKGVKIEICGDSEYVIKGLTLWMPSWIKRGFRTSSGTPVKNRDLWEKLHSLFEEIAKENEIKFLKIKAHSGERFNEMVDVLAKKEALNE